MGLKEPEKQSDLSRWQELLSEWLLSLRGQSYHTKQRVKQRELVVKNPFCPEKQVVVKLKGLS